MFKKVRKRVTDRQMMNHMYFFDKVKKIIVYVLLLSMVLNEVPWQALKAETELQIQDDAVTEYTYPSTTDSGFDRFDVQVKNEVVEHRTSNTKTFLKYDGSYEVNLYDGDIHYLNNGVYESIDNRLIDDGETYKNKANPYQIKLPKKIDESKKFKLAYDDYGLDFQVLGINKTVMTYDQEEQKANDIKEVIHINQKVFYKNILNGVDLEYVISGDKLKENIVLNQYQEDFSLSFSYETKDLSVIKDDENNIYLVNASQEIIFKFDKFFMVDANNKISYDVKINLLETSKNAFMLTIIPDEAWLKEASFPVVIDPTIILNGSEGYLRDKTVSGSGVNEYGSDLLVGTHMDTYKSYIEIDLASFSVLSSKEITYAFLNLGIESNDTNDAKVELKEVYDAYTYEHITSIYQSYTSIINIIDYNNLDNNDGVINQTYDVSKIFRKWIEQQDEKRILELSIADISSGYLAYDSIDDLDYDTVKPTLTVGFMDIDGYKPYWSYKSYDNLEAGVGYVSDFTGALTFMRHEFMFETDKQALGLSMIYNQSHKNENIGYGYGWQTNYNVKLYQDGSNRYIYEDQTRSKIYYAPLTTCDQRIPENDAYNTYVCHVAEDGSRHILVLQYTPYTGSIPYQKYILTPDGLKLSFGNDAYLDEIENTLYGLTIEISRESQDKDLVTSVMDQSGNEIRLSYINGLLSKSELITKVGSTTKVLEKVEYTYQNNQLILISHYKQYSGTVMVLDFESEYVYDTNQRLSLVISDSGLETFYQYVSQTNDKVDSVEIYNDDGQSRLNISYLMYTYQDYMTKITDQNGDFLAHYFDSYGHTITTINNEGIATHQKYMHPLSHNIGSQFNPNYVVINDALPNYLINHQVITNSNPAMSTTNPVYNHSFEFSTFDENDNWQKNPSVLTPYEVTFDDEMSVYGHQSLKIFSYYTDKQDVYQNIYIKDDQSYQLKGYI